MALRRHTLNDDMKDHDRDSHRHDLDLDEWTVAVVTHSEYCMMLRLSRLSAFWRAVRRSPALPLFSGLRSGENSVSANLNEQSQQG